MKLAFLLSIVLGICSYFWADPTVAIAMQSIPEWIKPIFHFCSFWITPPYHLVFWAMLTLVSLRFNRFIRYRYEFLRAFVMIVSIMFVTGVLKLLVSRARPDLFLNEGLFGFFCGQYTNAFRSFPSSHTAVAFGFCLLFADRLKWSTRYAITLAILLSISRICLNQHFVSDWIAGAMIGISIAFLLKKRASLWLAR